MKNRKAVILTVLLVMVCMLSSCELFFKVKDKGVVNIVTIGISYKWTPDPSPTKTDNLNFTIADSQEMGECLSDLAEKEGRTLDSTNSHISGTYTYFNFNDNVASSDPHFPSIANITAKINEINSNSTKNDKLIVFFSNHGTTETKYVDTQSSVQYSDSSSYQRAACMVALKLQGTTQVYDYFHCSDIYDLIDGFLGKKCIIADFCYGGSLITENNVSLDSYLYDNKWNSVDLFSDLLFSGTEVPDNPDFYILAASKPFEKSYEEGAYSHGVFTYAVLQALGWDFSGKTLSTTIPVCFLNQITLNDIGVSVVQFVSKTSYSSKQHAKITGGSDDLVLFDFSK